MIWPADRDNPLGWRDAGHQGAKSECLDYIEEVWTDMRPLSVRKQMDELASQDSVTGSRPAPGTEARTDRRD